jgi:hypothetical protein
MPFQKGQSGNPAGRVKSKAATLMGDLRKIVSADARATIKSISEQAKAGDVESRRLMLKLLPQAKWPTPFAMPEITGPGDLPQAVSAVLKAAAAGDLTLEDAERAVGLLAGLGKAYEGAAMVTTLEEMKAQLEALTARVGPLA